ncbi:MAG TPA: SGNH/GDSL hydrolase family protein, partial [Candidatus Sulfotelmatobacter sp.]|nr:SGNH/GDSL hydrolase family protein [Candidatus Sulfotelmatobacter sp.]
GASGIYPNFNQSHEGHPGATTQDILDGINDWAAQDQPDVVLLLIGANDFEQGNSPAHALANTHQIIDALRAENPQVVILWAMIPPIPGVIPQERAYNMALVHLAPQWSTPQSPIRVVNLWSNYFPAQDTVDGQHPNASGEKKIAERFYVGLVPILARFGQ